MDCDQPTISAVAPTMLDRLSTRLRSLPIKKAILLLMICFVAANCTLIKSKIDIDKEMGSTVIVGRVHGSFPVNGPIIVAASPMDGAGTIAHHTVLHDFGEYELMVGQGRYYVFAYQDNNRNLVYDAGEPGGHYGDPEAVQVPEVGVVFDIDIVISEGGHLRIPHGLKIAEATPQALKSRQAGAIADLDDPRFSEENGTKGFWEPGAFFREMGGNIYFLEAYDPEKTPILFIHGAGGSPKGWSYFVDHIDRTRFQPWFFYYPSGSRIDGMAHLLLWKLANLQAKYQFTKLYITAHSMGGLVARSFIVNYGQQFPCINLLISLATPWGGDRMAEYGVSQSPVVIPSWIDMQPEGDFIKSLYRKKMPESVNFYMFYGYRGNRSPFRSNNDGTITLSSLLDHRPQSEAEMNYAFDEDHASLLTSNEVQVQYNAILNALEDQKRASIEQPGGYLAVHVAYDYEYEGVRPRPTFILRHRSKKDVTIVSVLDDTGNGNRLGPIPAGEYLASVVTMAAKAKQKNVPVSIQSHQTSDVNFVFLPDGEIGGCVTSALQPEDKFAGRPDYRYRSMDSKIHIQSITLEGPGIHRRLGSTMVEDVRDCNGLYLAREDYCCNTCFVFFGLPAGDYRLFIEARGYHPIEKKYSISPGVPTYFRTTELTPD